MTVHETQRTRRGHAFLPPQAELQMIPALYATESTSAADKLLHLHYFVGGCDWWIAEYDAESDLAFGYACLNDPQNAEWGTMSLAELEQINARSGLLIVERDLQWTATTAAAANLPGRNNQEMSQS